MDKFFDALGDILKSLLGSDSTGSFSGRGTDARRPRYTDPDMQAAWDELEDFLKEDSDGERRTAGETNGRFRDPVAERRRESLRQDYGNLEVPFGASLETVRKSYKRLLSLYHPDKNSDDPEKLKTATEITKKLNVSYQRIEDFEDSQSAG
jgi:DnaJ-domain-containing protein 1